MNLQELTNLHEAVMIATSIEQEAKTAYKLLRIKKYFKKAYEEFAADEKELITEAGLSLETDFDKKNGSFKHEIDKEGKIKLLADEEKVKRFLELKAELLKRELTIDYELLTFEELFSIIKENQKNEKPLNSNLHLFTEGILWAEKEVKKEESNDNIPTA